VASLTLGLLALRDDGSVIFRFRERRKRGERDRGERFQDPKVGLLIKNDQTSPFSKNMVTL
jgi:hypothetical protein